MQHISHFIIKTTPYDFQFLLNMSDLEIRKKFKVLVSAETKFDVQFIEARLCTYPMRHVLQVYFLRDLFLNYLQN